MREHQSSRHQGEGARGARALGWGEKERRVSKGSKVSKESPAWASRRWEAWEEALCLAFQKDIDEE